jgi:hypothetical protein
MSRIEFGDITVIRAVIASPNEPSVPGRHGEDVFLMHRHDRHDRNRDQLENAGGQVGRDDPNPLTAVIRQIFKKSGLVVEFKRPELTCLEWRIMEDGGLYVAYAGVAHYIAGTPEITPEHDYAGWYNINQLEGQTLGSQTAMSLTMYREYSLGVEHIAGPDAPQIPDEMV